MSNSHAPVPPKKLTAHDLEILILKSVLRTDAKGRLVDLLRIGEATELLKEELKSLGHPQSAKVVMKNHYETAIRKGLITVSFPGSTSSQGSLDQRVKKLTELYELVEVRVVPSCAHETSMSKDEQFSALGREAASLFASILTGQVTHMTIGIGGGQTMHEMVSRLPKLNSLFTITATNFATRTPVDRIYDSSYLAMQVHGIATACRANICSFPPLPDDHPEGAIKMHYDIIKSNRAIQRIFSESKEPDVVFVGVGDFNRTSLVIERVYRHVGLEAPSLAEFRPVGDINLCIFDQHGDDLTPGIAKKSLKIKAGTLFPEDAHCHPFLIGLNMACFRALVQAKKKVIVVAGGAEKAQAIHALLNAKTKCINGLVTDETTLDKLLQLSETKGAAQ